MVMDEPSEPESEPEEPEDEIVQEEPEDEIVQEEPQDISSYFNTPFNEERLQNVHRLRSTPYKDECKYELQQTTLSPGAKRAIDSAIDQFLSERTILANFSSLEMALLKFELIFTKMKTNFCRTDLKNPYLFHITSLIQNHYDTILTNAFGADRERIVNGRESMEQRHVTKQEPIMVKPPNKRKNILGF